LIWWPHLRYWDQRDEISESVLRLISEGFPNSVDEERLQFCPSSVQYKVLPPSSISRHLSGIGDLYECQYPCCHILQF
jgi:hypothetical protein